MKGDRKGSLLLPLFSPLPSFLPSFQKENCSVNCLQSAFSFKIRPVLIPVSIYRSMRASPLAVRVDAL